MNWLFIRLNQQQQMKCPWWRTLLLHHPPIIRKSFDMKISPLYLVSDYCLKQWWETDHICLVNWLDFGAFSSFAPASDSNNANATYENTYMGRSAKRFKKWEQKQLEKEDETKAPPAVEEMDTNDEELNALWLEKEGFDVKAIEEAINKEPDNVAEELERNCQLLEELVKYQHARFSAGKTKWDAVEEKEVEIGKCFLLYDTHSTHLIPTWQPKHWRNTWWTCYPSYHPTQPPIQTW